MADDQKQSYPRIPVKHWWTLRRQFVKTVSTTVDAKFIAETLGMQESSARTNILPALVTMGIIGEDGEATPLAIRWRDDQQYASVCAEIRQRIYPRDLIESHPGPEIDRRAVQQWFMNRCRVGEDMATKMRVLYGLLCRADPAEGVQKESSPPRQRRATPRASQKEKPSVTPPAAAVPTQEIQPTASQPSSAVPPQQEKIPIHFDIQIHISPDFSPEQIDKIFESMAKHLSKFVNHGNG